MAFHLSECLESAVLSTPSVYVLRGVLFHSGGCEYPKSLCRRWCFVAGVGDACCCINLVSLLVRGISLRKSVCYWYATFRGRSFELVGISHLQLGPASVMGKGGCYPGSCGPSPPAACVARWPPVLAGGAVSRHRRVAPHLLNTMWGWGVWPSGPYQMVDPVRQRTRMEGRHWCHSSHRVTQS